jgi:hypothetical protein
MPWRRARRSGESDGRWSSVKLCDVVNLSLAGDLVLLVLAVRLVRRTDFADYVDHWTHHRVLSMAALAAFDRGDYATARRL